ncbi:hypothetical protein [Brevundimonas subvibrioides]|uniref:Uncharacterized protein n=1 Tax=Brevundimonas subvibrioides (strain ATCC 15264 / DSM 4735 / LMG 14903 / NBRC 16000 / CB 81) TaxID=633149 RepID=D9QKQ2_BRESC|nr:hypothetical protein [Brevundimonas subvibrioides]ADL01716.1 hypothetical protein Bresu_2407 [Brevundimonas subvibrioides ATCC 15264]
MTDIDSGRDDQDQSEAFDEDNVDASETGGVTNEFKTFEEMPDVLDVTSADGDADEEDFDEDDQEIEDDLGADGVEPEADAQYGADGSRINELDLGADSPGNGEVELVYAGLMEDARGAQASAAHWEAKTLSDDDIEDLGYGPEGDEK